MYKDDTDPSACLGRYLEPAAFGEVRPVPHFQDSAGRRPCPQGGFPRPEGLAPVSGSDQDQPGRIDKGLQAGRRKTAHIPGRAYPEHRAFRGRSSRQREHVGAVADCLMHPAPREGQARPKGDISKGNRAM